MDIEEFKKQYEENNPAPKWNKKECGEGCNCIDIAEFNNGGEPVKNYPCKSPHTPFDKD